MHLNGLTLTDTTTIGLVKIVMRKSNRLGEVMMSNNIH